MKIGRARILLSPAACGLLAASLGVPALGVATGCANPTPPNSPAAAPDRAAAAPVPTVVVPRTVVTPNSAESADEALAKGVAAGDCGVAAAYFERSVALDPQGPLAEEALFRAGEAHDACGKLEAALARYEQLARQFPAGRYARAALVRSVRLAAHLERWARVGATADLVLERHAGLTPLEQVAVLSGKALALVAAEDDRHAEYFAEKARGVVEAHGLDAADRIPRDVAMTFFALGEIRRVRAERIKFVPRPAHFGGELERRCQLLLDSQSAYSSAMRAYDAHWSAMSGYRVGALYQSLHRDLMDLMENAPPSAADTPARRQLFEGAMRLRYSILLTKAQGMMEHTLAMAARTGERSAWVLKAEQARVELGRSIAAEDAAIARLPYTRADLQAALDDLGRKGP